MSILIRGMEMPKSPGAYSMKIRLFVREDGTASIWGLEEYIPHEPLDVIPVQEHGRLIDADALTAKFKEMGLGEHSLIERLFADGVYVMIDYAPTIIPREEGE